MPGTRMRAERVIRVIRARSSSFVPSIIAPMRMLMKPRGRGTWLPEPASDLVRRACGPRLCPVRGREHEGAGADPVQRAPFAVRVAREAGPPAMKDRRHAEERAIHLGDQLVESVLDLHRVRF